MPPPNSNLRRMTSDQRARTLASQTDAVNASAQTVHELENRKKKAIDFKDLELAGEWEKELAEERAQLKIAQKLRESTFDQLSPEERRGARGYYSAPSVAIAVETLVKGSAGAIYGRIGRNEPIIGGTKTSTISVTIVGGSPRNPSTRYEDNNDRRDERRNQHKERRGSGPKPRKISSADDVALPEDAIQAFVSLQSGEGDVGSGVTAQRPSTVVNGPILV